MAEWTANALGEKYGVEFRRENYQDHYGMYVNGQFVNFGDNAVKTLESWDSFLTAIAWNETRHILLGEDIHG